MTTYSNNPPLLDGEKIPASVARPGNQGAPDPDPSATEQLAQRIQRWRWQAPLLALILVAIHQLLEHTWLQHLSRWQHFVSQLLFYGVVGPTLAWWALTTLYHRVQETARAYRALAETGQELDRVNRRLTVLLAINRRLVEAEDEEELLKSIVELPQQVMPLMGASFIPFDDQGYPRRILFHGDLELEWVEGWIRRFMEKEGLYQRCQTCIRRHQAGHSTAHCPLQQETTAAGVRTQIYCLPLVRGQRPFGLLNLYLAPEKSLSREEEMLLSAMGDEMALALESSRLRARELTTLYRLQQWQQRDSLQTMLTEVLADTVKALEADGGWIFLEDREGGALYPCAQVGASTPGEQTLLEGLVTSMRSVQSPLILGDVAQEDASPGFRSLLLAPMRFEGQHVGCLVLWSAQGHAFSRRHARLAATVAMQSGLIVENQRLSARVEHQAALAERARLAREIHDGLAQTLGYLKLRTAQIGKWLQQQELGRAQEALEQVRSLIAAAYVDAREAIDGLRLQPGEGSIRSWFLPLLEDFRALSSVEIIAGEPPPVSLPAEVHIQLLRIVQEALGNVRKHSGADRAVIEWQVEGSWLTLSISDNGRGFEAQDVPPFSRHGLRIMQERAELIDGDFQIVSHPGKGAQVIVRLPIPQENEAHV